MGEARARGTYEQRKAKAQLAEDCEVLIFLKSDEGHLNVQILPRDEEPDEHSPAVIFAAFLNQNMEGLTKAAMDSYRQYQAEQAGEGAVLTEAPQRSIQTAEGDIAKKDDVGLLGPDGRPMQ